LLVKPIDIMSSVHPSSNWSIIVTLIIWWCNLFYYIIRQNRPTLISITHVLQVYVGLHSALAISIYM